MATVAGDDDDLFDSLSRKIDPAVTDEREKAVQERVRAQYEAAAKRLENLIDANETLPVTINSIRVLGATRTRRAFLDRLFNPILSANQDHPYTLHEALHALGSSADKLRKFGIYQDNISMFVDRPDQTDPSTTTNDIDVWLSVKERGRWSIRTGTNLGNTEGEAYGNVLLRNIFGGAESLEVNAAAGTRTRSAYSAVLSTPILSDPDLRLSFQGLASSTQKPWASHEEAAKGAGIKFRWPTTSGTTHELGYYGVWRQVTALASNASPTVRQDAGDTVKSSVSHTYISEKRDNPLLPTRGTLVKAVGELAGFGPLQGDVSFFKYELETAAAMPLQFPGTKTSSGVSLSGNFRAGMLLPLPLGMASTSRPSRVNDRFVLGGPTDVRGFKIGGLGPRDGPDGVGGDVFAAASLNLLMPLPRVGKDSPLRLQAFLNGGRLLALKDLSSTRSDGTFSTKAVRRSLAATLAEMGNGLPSMAAGVGLVYAHPIARFELNFGLPLVTRKGEMTAKGFQFGVGINFM